jgi:BirA family transcriptional regulator, biotin operon repressor / biotin---[acetyl-CoA-carboxylase] ligase
VARTPLDGDRLRAALGARWPRLTVVDETSSTNGDLLTDPSAPDRTLLVAEHQVAGRGRFDRTWSSPRGAGLTFSVLLRPTAPVQHWGWLPLLAGLALHEAVSSATGVRTSVKWPNDLLAEPDGGKLAGILAQTGGGAVVIGIGLNVDTTAEELPVPTATSLARAGGRGLDRTELLTAVLRRLDARVAQWDDADGDAGACGLSAAYRAACSTLGRPVRVALADGTTVTGDAEDVDDAGRLVVRAAGGPHTVAAGDVEHVRPA